ncbi:hypothetical protein Q7C36_021350 [Tachysurus vachellii]|uniref:Uncharacterized protein n=1 Tax=Tachysurus vachellii TaxID=175792 RepID=A0AA88ITL6_TACVA|nr:hypothetical protein Q7C36_021350 [Tachysurus vachellii]
MVSTCTHGLQPCSWHKRHGKRECNNRKRSRCRRDGKRSSQAIVPPADGTHGTVVVVASGRSDSRQLRIVFASWDAWHCHFINYL